MEAQQLSKEKAKAEKKAAIKSDSGKNAIGAVKIADDVVAMIAALAALEVDGVSSLAGGVMSDQVGRINRSKLSRCVKVTVDGGQVRVDMAVMLRYGYNIPTTSGKVQTRVKAAIENMTGLRVLSVNVRIAEITMPAVSEAV